MKKRIVVIGATGFIGGSIAQALTFAGYHVIGVGRSPAVLARMHNQGVLAGTAYCDVTSAVHCKVLFARHTELGDVVYSVGDCGKGKYREYLEQKDLQEQDYIREMAMHCGGLEHVLCECEIRRCAKKIVVIGSAITRLLPHLPPFLEGSRAYAIAKKAQEEVVSGWQARLKPRGIKLMLRSPSAVKTPFWDGAPEQFLPRAYISLEEIARNVASAFGDDNAPAVEYLINPAELPQT